MKLKAGDIVVCINRDPIDGAGNTHLRHLRLGEVYEVVTNESSFGGVMVAVRLTCGFPGHDCNFLVSPYGFSYDARRFYKVGSL